MNLKRRAAGMPAEAWLSTQSTMLQAMQTAAFIDRSIFAELFVHVVRHGGAGADLVEEAAWRTAAFSVACLKSKSAPGTGADVLRCLLHSGAAAQVLGVCATSAADPAFRSRSTARCFADGCRSRFDGLRCFAVPSGPIGGRAMCQSACQGAIVAARCRVLHW